MNGVFIIGGDLCVSPVGSGCQNTAPAERWDQRSYHVCLLTCANSENKELSKRKRTLFFDAGGTSQPVAGGRMHICTGRTYATGSAADPEPALIPEQAAPMAHYDPLPARSLFSPQRLPDTEGCIAAWTRLAPLPGCMDMNRACSGGVATLWPPAKGYDASGIKEKLPASKRFRSLFHWDLTPPFMAEYSPSLLVFIITPPFMAEQARHSSHMGFSPDS